MSQYLQYQSRSPLLLIDLTFVRKTALRFHFGFSVAVAPINIFPPQSLVLRLHLLGPPETSPTYRKYTIYRWRVTRFGSSLALCDSASACASLLVRLRCRRFPQLIFVCISNGVEAYSIRDSPAGSTSSLWSIPSNDNDFPYASHLKPQSRHPSHPALVAKHQAPAVLLRDDLSNHCGFDRLKHPLLFDSTR